MKRTTKREIEQMNTHSIRESLFDDLSATLAKYKGIENTEDNRKKLRADIAKTLYDITQTN